MWDLDDVPFIGGTPNFVTQLTSLILIDLCNDHEISPPKIPRSNTKNFIYLLCLTAVLRKAHKAIGPEVKWLEDYINNFTLT